MMPRDGGDAGGRSVPAAALYDVVSPAVEQAIVSLVRELASATPAPTHDPFYGLDRIGSDYRVVHFFARRPSI